MKGKQMKKTSDLPCTPLNDFVLLKLITESNTEGGLHLPEKAIKSGVVQAIGPGVDIAKFPFLL